MLNLSRSSNYSNNLPYSEMSDCSRLDRQQKSRLPRHISALESYGHSNIRPEIFKAVQKCPLNRQPDSNEVVNAVKILQYQLQDNASQRQHLKNLRSNLMHRLQVAKSTNNIQLVTLLQEEFRQLEVST